MSYPISMNPKNGYSKYHLVRKFKRQLIGERSCVFCGSKNIEVHHEDYGKNNHDPSNLILVCHKCHIKHFHKGRPHPNYKRLVPSKNRTQNVPGDTTMENPTLGLHEVAMILRVSNAWVYRQVKKGCIPNQRIGFAIRFHRKDIDELMDACKTGKSGGAGK